MDQVHDLLKDLLWGAPLVLLLALLIVQVVREFRRGPSKAVKNGGGKISLSDRVYFMIPPSDVVLMSLSMDSIQSIKLPMRDARAVFRMLKFCCEMHELQEVEIGELSWKIDGRTNSPEQQTMVVQFDGPQGWTREVVSRSGVLAAVTNFSNQVGL
jgi:hypothetical protein